MHDALAPKSDSISLFSAGHHYDIQKYFLIKILGFLKLTFVGNNPILYFV